MTLDIKNVGIGVLTKKNEIKIYSVSKPDGIGENNALTNMELISGMKETITSDDDIDVSEYHELDNRALVNEDCFFINLKDLKENNEFYYLKNGLAKEGLIFNSEQIGLKKEELESLDKNNEHVRFWILEEEKRYLLLYVNPYSQIIKHKRGINIGTKPTKFEIIYGIVYPDHISAILSKDDYKLSIINVADFERMFNLKAVRFAQANEVLTKFRNKKYKLGKDNIEIIFDSDVNLNSSEYGKTRQITYLSSYDPKQTKYKKESIKNAMKHLKKEERLKIVGNKIKVSTPKQFKTFVAILHDSILHRMLSDKYESI